MKLQTLAQAYGSEVQFTQALSQNVQWLSELYEECGFQPPQEILAQAEVRTELNKRVDVVVYDNNEAHTCIECQDISGELDPIHASKTIYYMHDMTTECGIILCDTAPNSTKDFIRMINLKCDMNIAIVNVRFVDKEPVFTCIERPFDRRTRNHIAKSDYVQQLKDVRKPYFDKVVDNDKIYPITPSDRAIVIKSPSSNKKTDYLNNVSIYPMKTVLVASVPKKYNPESLFTDINWKDHGGSLSEEIVKGHFPLDTDINKLVDEIASLM